jgi:hypothetical protein
MTVTVVTLIPATFETFWAECPKKVGRIIAQARFDAITGDGLHTRTKDRDSDTYVDVFLKAAPQEIIDGMKRYRKRVWITEETEARWILHPSTWLNRGGWLDD